MCSEWKPSSTQVLETIQHDVLCVDNITQHTQLIIKQLKTHLPFYTIIQQTEKNAFQFEVITYICGAVCRIIIHFYIKCKDKIQTSFIRLCGSQTNCYTLFYYSIYGLDSAIRIPPLLKTSCNNWLTKKESEVGVYAPITLQQKEYIHISFCINADTTHLLYRYSGATLNAFFQKFPTFLSKFICFDSVQKCIEKNNVKHLMVWNDVVYQALLLCRMVLAPNRCEDITNLFAKIKQCANKRPKVPETKRLEQFGLYVLQTL